MEESLLTINFILTKKIAIRFFVNINPRLTLRDKIRERLQDVLIWIDIENDESKLMLIDIKDIDGIPTGEQHIVIPAFDLYSKEVGEGSGRDRVSNFVYEIRTPPANLSTLKSLLCHIYQKNIFYLKNIPYGLDKQTYQKILRDIILQQNNFLSEMAIIPITGLNKKGKQEVEIILRISLFFSGM